MNTMRVRIWAVLLMLFACTFVYTSVMSLAPSSGCAALSPVFLL